MMENLTSKNPQYEILGAPKISQPFNSSVAQNIPTISKNNDYEILPENYIPTYSELKPTDQKKVKDLFFEMNPHLPRNEIGNLIFKFGTYLSEPAEKFKPRNAFEKKLHEAVLQHGDRALGLPSDVTPGAPGTFARSATRSLLQGTADIASLLPGYPEINAEDIIPVDKEEMNSPLAGFAGQAVGYGAPAMLGIEGLRGAVPAWNALAEKAAPYLLKRLGVASVEGAASGAAISKPGERVEGGILGAVGSPLLQEIIRAPFALGRALKKWWELPDIKGLIKQEISLKETAENADKELEQAKEFSEIEHGGANSPRALIGQVNNHQAEIEQAKQRIAELEPIANNNLLSQDEINNMRIEHSRNLRNAQEDKEVTDEALSQYLGEGEEHDVALAEHQLEADKAKREEIGQQFESLRSDLSKQNIELTNSGEAGAIATDVRDLIKDGSFRGEEARQAIEEFDSAFGSKTGNIPADKFLTMLQTAKKLEADAWRKGYDPNETQSIREEWQDKAGALSAKVQRMEKAFEQGVGKENYARYKKAAEEWKTQVIPLRKNSLFAGLRRGQKAPANFIERLKGNEPAIALMRERVKANPLATRAIIGQKYAANPKNLHKPSDTLEEYVAKLPQLSFLKESNAKAIQNLKTAKENFDFFQEKAPGFIQQAAEKEKAVAEKTATEKRIDDLHKKIADKEKTIKKLQEAEQRKDVSLKEHLAIKKQLDDAKKSRKELMALVTKIGLGVAALGGGTYTANKYTSGDF